MALIPHPTTMARWASLYQIEERGSLHTFQHKIYYNKDGKYVSPFHDIPRQADETKKIYNIVVEVPR